MQANKKINGFMVPDGYFDNLTSQIQNNIYLAEVNKTETDKIFLIPKNYFQNLENKLNKISETKDIETKPAKIFQLKFTKYAAAACVLLVCAFAVYINIASNNVQKQLANLSNEDLEFYLQNNTNNTDMQTIIQNVEYIKTDIDEQISTKELNEYLNQSI